MSEYMWEAKLNKLLKTLVFRAEQPFGIIIIIKREEIGRTFSSTLTFWQFKMYDIDGNMGKKLCYLILSPLYVTEIFPYSGINVDICLSPM